MVEQMAQARAREYRQVLDGVSPPERAQARSALRDLADRLAGADRERA